MKVRQLTCIRGQKYITGGNIMTHKTKFATLASLIAMLGVLCVAPKEGAACTAAIEESEDRFTSVW